MRTRRSAGRCRPPDFPRRDALEPNDDGLRATHAAEDRSTATIAPEGDVDWYVVRRPLARARRDSTSSAPRVRRPHRAEPPSGRAALRRRTSTRSRTPSADSQRARLAFRLPAGLYYLRVANGSGARSAGTYSVTLAMRRSRGIAAQADALALSRLERPPDRFGAARRALAQNARLAAAEVDHRRRDARELLLSSTAAAASRNSSGTSSRRPGSGPPGRFALVAASAADALQHLGARLAAAPERALRSCRSSRRSAS